MVLFLNIIWLSFDWPGMIKVSTSGSVPFQKGNFLNIIRVYLEYSQTTSSSQIEETKSTGVARDLLIFIFQLLISALFLVTRTNNHSSTWR